MRAVLEGGHLAEAQLVEDPAGLLVPEVVSHLALQVGQGLKRGGRELGCEGQGLKARDETVAAEDGHEPGQPGGRQGAGDQGRHEDVGPGGEDVGQAEELQIGEQTIHGAATISFTRSSAVWAAWSGSST